MFPDVIIPFISLASSANAIKEAVDSSKHHPRGTRLINWLQLNNSLVSIMY